MESSSITAAEQHIFPGKYEIIVYWIAAIIMSQSSIPDAQPDPFREFFRPQDSQIYSYYSSPEIPDSQNSQPIIDS